MRTAPYIQDQRDPATLQGCAKYGLPGLTCLVRWHETVDIPFGAAVSGSQLPGPRPTLERLLLVLLRRVEDRSHSLAGKDRKADNLKVLAMEVRCCINSPLQLSEGTWLRTSSAMRMHTC